VKLGPLRQNYKGIIPTSTSLGNENFRVNVSDRGTRTTAKIPGTNIRTHGYSGTGRRRASTHAASAQEESGKKKGCLRGCSPLVLILVVLVVLVVLGVT
jgi:hypothetical protein